MTKNFSTVAQVEGMLSNMKEWSAWNSEPLLDAKLHWGAKSPIPVVVAVQKNGK